MYVNCYKIKWLARPRLSRKWCWGFGWGVCFVYLRAGTVRINFLKNAFFNSEYERIDGFQWFALHGKYLCIIDCWHAFVVCPGELTESSTSAFHLLPLPITVPTRFRAILHHEWISRCVSRKPCSKQWTVTSDKNSAVQTIKTGRSPVLKWDWNCWDGSWNCQEIAGKCLPAGCSTAGLHLERTSNWRTTNVMSWADSCSWWAELRGLWQCIVIDQFDRQCLFSSQCLCHCDKMHYEHEH